MKPLNYAILDFFLERDKASVLEVMEGLKKDYSTFKAFNKKSIIEALMTAEANGLIEEVELDLDINGELLIYYSMNEASKEAVKKYIG